MHPTDSNATFSVGDGRRHSAPHVAGNAARNASADTIDCLGIYSDMVTRQQRRVSGDVSSTDERAASVIVSDTYLGFHEQTTTNLRT